MPKQLKPLKHPQGDLFVCDVTDVILKDDMASMEHPFYSLSKKPDRDPRRYEYKGQWIEFRPSIKGMPTIYDKDLIIYAISQLIGGMKEGRPVSKRVLIEPYAFLTFTQRGTGGRRSATASTGSTAPVSAPTSSSRAPARTSGWESSTAPRCGPTRRPARSSPWS